MTTKTEGLLEPPNRRGYDPSYWVDQGFVSLHWWEQWTMSYSQDCEQEPTYVWPLGLSAVTGMSTLTSPGGWGYGFCSWHFFLFFSYTMASWLLLSINSFTLSLSHISGISLVSSYFSWQANLLVSTVLLTRWWTRQKYRKGWHVFVSKNRYFTVGVVLGRIWKF